MKFGKGFVGSSGKCFQMAPDQVMKAMSEDQIMQVKSDAFAATFAGASMSAISSLASMLSQRPASAGRKRKENQLHREVSAATLISQRVLKTKNGEAVDVALSEMDRVDDNDDDDDYENGMDEYEGEKSFENVGI